jgi:endonuclease YncB( thermonuclease family)
MNRVLCVALALGPSLIPVHASVLASGNATAGSGNELVVRGITFRLRDADAFELGQKCWSSTAEIDCGARSRDALREIVKGKEVFCGAAGVGQRVALSHCWTNDKINVAEEMIRHGWAFARPDRSGDSAKSLCDLEAQAKRLQRGVWRGYKFVLPLFHRGEKSREGKPVSCGNEPQFRP